MSQASISPALRQAVADHFEHRCSYCRTSAQIVGAEFTIDHIVPQSLGGASTEDNLCLACWRCNLIKRDRIAAADSESGVIVRLFNPRQQPCGTVRPHPVAPGAELHRRMQWSPTAIVLRDEAHQTPNHCR